MTRGRFIGVVGPSGAGKDSLIDAARRHFGEHGPVRFVTRAITRSQDAGGEAYAALSEAELQARAAAGGFTLHWQAHGLSYGIPIDIEETLALGRSVLVNLSRSVIDDIRTRFPNRLILVVTASPDILAQIIAIDHAHQCGFPHARWACQGNTFPGTGLHGQSLENRQCDPILIVQSEGFFNIGQAQ